MIRNRIRFVRVTEGPAANIAIVGYVVGLWLPAYFLARLVPRYGSTMAARIAWRSVAWNVGDARSRASWTLIPPSGEA